MTPNQKFQRKQFSEQSVGTSSDKQFMSPSNKQVSQSRPNRLKQIDAIYKSQIQEIYSSSATSTTKDGQIHDQRNKPNQQSKVKKPRQNQQDTTLFGRKKALDTANIQIAARHNKPKPSLIVSDTNNSVNNLNLNMSPSSCMKSNSYCQELQHNNLSGSSSSRVLNSVASTESKLRSGLSPASSSRMLHGEVTSTRAMELLRKQSQNKQIKIRQLSSKCEHLLEKLKKTLSPVQFQQEMSTIQRLTENKIVRFQNLFKIKNEELFFKIKLQIVSLLQEFQIPKQELGGINQIQTESQLFSYMSRKLKSQLKLFRTKEQDSQFEMQKDRLLAEKYEERIHHLTETNELMKLSQSKLKQKNQALKTQLNQFLDKIHQKQLQIQQQQSEIFRAKKQLQDVHSHNSRYHQLQRKTTQERQQQKKQFEIKEKQMKGLLSNYYLQKQKLEKEIQQKQAYIDQILIKEKYLEQQNDRINREMLRWKERYEWIEKELDLKQKEFQQEKQAILSDTENYKATNNQNILLQAKTETQEALRRVEEYQLAYNKLLDQFEMEKKASHLKSQQHSRAIEMIEQQWIQKIKKVQAIREEEMVEVQAEFDFQQKQMRKEFERKEQTLAGDMQAKMKALLAEKDKKMTQKIMQIQAETDRVRKQLQESKELIYKLQHAHHVS